MQDIAGPVHQKLYIQGADPSLSQPREQLLDWYVRIGQLKPGEVKASDVYTNRFNPFHDMAAK
jgi:hypothetical protein